MAETNAPKGDRIGNDYQRGPNPDPGGAIDTGDSAVPPYEDRSDGNNRPRDGTARAMGSKAPLKEPAQPGSDTTPEDAAMAPKDVGESIGRRGEDVADKDGKESGREDTGRKGETARPTGTSGPRDETSIQPQEGNTGKSN
ncbi:MAG: hypothetical protein M3021_12155 [Actinomycetota bacterium]|nr:hypothetical protein [Actinomycetota bacterium]